METVRAVSPFSLICNAHANNKIFMDLAYPFHALGDIIDAAGLFKPQSERMGRTRAKLRLV